ncbi:hypothetical protein E4198_14695 [Streptomyces sp. RKND-216]|jgi:hypothetical protein|uniref:hypothetical protein n=1 Tax=Streptomyces sp. RKND-216 TaxID=2562581 RepID=UPI00109DFE03|nr:hypothetical protein [Streptomyces sp. RKND-216]THA25342.1 hypothetical protein E4198_11955 [Streptomyces sp. RKND-216]THA25780.1 hypothetical protein E4198_14695 [Streptomyces sp. RKND-216]
MSVEIPLVALLAVFGYFGIKLFRPPTWLVVTLLLGGFLLADTFIAPVIEGGAETGTQIVNGTND